MDSLNFNSVETLPDYKSKEPSLWFVGFVRLDYMVSSLISAFVKEGISW